MSRAPLLALLFPLSVLAGCIGVVDAPEASGDATGLLAAGEPVVFSTPILIDEVRAGGEPVIAITPTGTILVAAHPGFTHTRYPPSPNLLTPVSGQSYLWRSVDDGVTFQPVGLPGADGLGPRGVGQGVSDPDFAIDANGRIYLTDLEALAAASVSWSDDDGETWLMGNNLASTYGPVDRQWLATHGTDVYFIGNYFVDQRVLKSTDGGLTWLQVGSANCGGDLVADEDGVLLVGCGPGIDVSEDGGATFEVRRVPGAKSWARDFAEPALDAAGNVYTAWADAKGVWLAGSPDLGRTWWPSINVAAPAYADGAMGTNVWPWVVAGDAGRVAVLWYGTADPAGPREAAGDWFVHHATVLGADTTAPTLSHAQVTPTPMFQGATCQSGTTCQADPTPAGDRRLGDFFEAAVDAQGYVHVAYSVALDDSISHPGYARQTAGPRLRG